MTLISFWLEFEYTNNTTKYEALVQGLKQDIDLNVKCLKVFGDLEIIVK
jgi:ribonuclease HI